MRKSANLQYNDECRSGDHAIIALVTPVHSLGTFAVKIKRDIPTIYLPSAFLHRGRANNHQDGSRTKEAPASSERSVSLAA